MVSSAVTVALRFSDSDAYGHVHHAAYLSLIEQARIDWLNLLMRDDPQSDFDHTIVSLTINYRRELRLEDRAVHCSFAVESVGSSSIVLLETIAVAGTGVEVANLRTVVLAWDVDAHQKVVLDSHQRDRLSTVQAQHSAAVDA